MEIKLISLRLSGVTVMILYCIITALALTYQEMTYPVDASIVVLNRCGLVLQLGRNYILKRRLSLQLRGVCHTKCISHNRIQLLRL
jgi:hypothetical protein